MRAENRRIRSVLLACACVVLSLASASPGVVGGPEGVGEFDNPDSQWSGMTLDWIGRIGGGSAVAVGNRWLVSAAHLSISVGSQVELPGGSFHTVAEVHGAPSVGLGTPDLTIVRVAEELPGWYDVYDGVFASGAPVIMAGTGYGGTVDPVDDTFNWSAGTQRDWRWGTNEISRGLWVPSGPYASLSIQMDFGYGDTEYEVGLASGDSGGGTFLHDDGQWKLVGVNTYISMIGGGSSPPYNTTSAVYMPNYVDWVESFVPTGDLNGDDVVDAADIDLLFDHIAGSVAAGDVNSDGAVDAGDVDFLIRGILETEYGDFDLDGRIDNTDLTALGANMGSLGVGWADGDVNGDGAVDNTDLTVLATYFDVIDGDPSTPEPGSAILVLAGAIGALRRRRRQ